MFKRVAIELTGPLCACPEMKLSWGISRPASKPGEHGKAGLFLRCNECGTTLTVPHKHFVASFRLDTPYPGREDEEGDDEPKLEVLEGGKLLKFDLSDNEKIRDDESQNDV